jgi:hypothetical protein
VKIFDSSVRNGSSHSGAESRISDPVPPTEKSKEYVSAPGRL